MFTLEPGSPLAGAPATFCTEASEVAALARPAAEREALRGVVDGVRRRRCTASTCTPAGNALPGTRIVVQQVAFDLRAVINVARAGVGTVRRLSGGDVVALDPLGWDLLSVPRTPRTRRRPDMKWNPEL